MVKPSEFFLKNQQKQQVGIHFSLLLFMSVVRDLNYFNIPGLHDPYLTLPCRVGGGGVEGLSRYLQFRRINYARLTPVFLLLGARLPQGVGGLRSSMM